MSNAVFWGLTNKDFENALWNGLSQTAVCIGGALVAAIANSLTNKDFENVLWNGVTWLAVGYAGKAVGAIVAMRQKKFCFLTY